MMVYVQFIQNQKTKYYLLAKRISKYQKLLNILNWIFYNPKLNLVKQNKNFNYVLMI